MLSLWKFIHIPEAAFILTLGVCCLIGFVNGFIVTKFKVPSMIVTLGVLFSLQGLSWVFGRTPQGIPFVKSGFAQWMASSNSYLSQLLWAVFFAAIFWILLNRTRFGNWVLFTGGNERAAIDCGINTSRVKTICFILCSSMAALGGITAGIRTGGTSPLLGVGLVVEVIIIAVLGGTSLSGGKGSILGTVIMALIIRLISLGTVFLKLSSAVYMFILGGFLIIYCILFRSKTYMNFMI
jgi:simple sugar transport system permease protein